MALQRITAEELLGRWQDFDAIIDARSESEFAEDRLPQAQNWPSLTDAERHDIGTLYKQVSPFAARKRGAALVAQNIARHLQNHTGDLQRDWRPLVYCWRGGQRSGALALVLEQIGFSVCVLQGGYRAFRSAVVLALETLPAQFRYHVLSGRTGSGKSLLLRQLLTAGAQVLDLEALAEHRGSILGALPGNPQPGQKAFETRLWQALRALDPTRLVFVESESRKVGNVHLPNALVKAMRAAPCTEIELGLAHRVELLLQEYAHFTLNPDLLCDRLEALVALRGRDTVSRWQQQARAGDWPGFVAALLNEHYDPIYRASMARNFAQQGQLPACGVPNASELAFRQAALYLVATAIP
jgi:tRNA 2-selenouridine synthase